MYRSIVFTVLLVAVCTACEFNDLLAIEKGCGVRNVGRGLSAKVGWDAATSGATVHYGLISYADGKDLCLDDLRGKCFNFHANVDYSSGLLSDHVVAGDGALIADLDGISMTERKYFLLLQTTTPEGDVMFGVGDTIIEANVDELEQLERREIQNTVTEYTVEVTIDRSSSSSGGFPLWALAIIIPVPIVCCCCLLLLLLLLCLLLFFLKGGEESEKRSHKVSNMGSLQADADDSTSYRGGRGGTKTGNAATGTNKEYPDTATRLSLTHQDNEPVADETKSPRRKHIIAQAETSSLRDWREMS